MVSLIFLTIFTRVCLTIFFFNQFDLRLSLESGMYLFLRQDKPENALKGFSADYLMALKLFPVVCCKVGNGL